ncbi:hypothetical protein E3C22_03365 [Jiella endophytica]|uniref:Uncharacterized protein n=1 Tax=Jiella endophytica TaxID=2558362 RepID=A0A4Y8RT80_9HYPH|nr:hypothetical protein [Jiella endophytica]TFF27509.1 hypothetical protein E3C22_03365 [Jiella endophytica]
MTLTFPLDRSLLSDLLPIASVKWVAQDNQEISGMGSGQILATELAPSLWTADVTTAERYHDEIDRLQARLESLNGSINPFYLVDPKRRFPQYDPDGSKLGGATPTINSISSNGRSISLTGLPGLYTLSFGDFLCFDYGTPARRAFHRIVETAIAGNSSGTTALFEIRPFVPLGASVGLPVTLLHPAMKCILRPNSLDAETVTALTSRLSFSAVQKL